MYIFLIFYFLFFPATPPIDPCPAAPPAGQFRFGIDDVTVLSTACKVFANREQAVAQVFCVNTTNAFYAAAEGPLQSLRLPLMVQTYGAGKTKFAVNYVTYLAKYDVKKAIEKQVHPAVSAQVKLTLAAFTEKSAAACPLTIRVDAEVNLHSLMKRMAWEASGQHYDNVDNETLRRIFHAVRQQRAVALFVDEIGKVENYDNFRNMRETLMTLVRLDLCGARWCCLIIFGFSIPPPFSRDSTPGLKPLHVGVMGRVDAAFFRSTSGHIGAPYRNCRVSLEPLRGSHVREIYEAYLRLPEHAAAQVVVPEQKLI
jgi:hypothetical protein